MKKLFALLLSCAAVSAMSQTQAPPKDSHIVDGFTSVMTIAGETNSPETPQDSVIVSTPDVTIPLWKQKLYYGYNFDIYYHHDSRSNRKENGFSIAITPEIGWKLNEKWHLGMRFGGSYQHIYTTYSFDILDTTSSTSLRVQQGSWEVAPYVRYKMKSLFNGKLDIWMEAHLYTGMEFPRVTDGDATGTDYDGLRHSITYGAQLSPVITYKFNRKSTFQVFFSILSLGYSGTTYCYSDPQKGKYNEYTNDVILFSGKLRNLIANQFTPGLYGLKFGIQKSF
jgi:hypothetical protein